MPKIVVKRERTAVIDGQERVVSKGAQYYVADTGRDFSTEFCNIPKELLQQDRTHKIGNHEFCVFEATPGDEQLRLARDVQLITIKDLGFIGARIGAHKGMLFAEAGTGSGGATCYFAPLVKHVYSYDVRANSAEKVQKDLARLGFSNVTLATGSVYEPEAIGCRDVDAFLLDVPEPWNAWETMRQCVKIGGYVVGYTPSANQLQQFCNAAPRDFLQEDACELILREWKVRGLVVRPSTADFGHTAFLSFFRRISG